MKQKINKNALVAGNLFNKQTKKLVNRKKAIFFDENFYLSLSKRMANKESAGQVLKTSNTTGRCYFYALLVAYAMPDSTLVHGNLRSLDYLSEDENSYEFFDHAWVECHGKVFDTTQRACYDKEAYYKTFEVEQRKVFSQDELVNSQVFRDLARQATKLHLELEEKLLIFPQFSNEKNSQIREK